MFKIDVNILMLIVRKQVWWVIVYNVKPTIHSGRMGCALFKIKIVSHSIPSHQPYAYYATLVTSIRLNYKYASCCPRIVLVWIYQADVIDAIQCMYWHRAFNVFSLLIVWLTVGWWIRQTIQDVVCVLMVFLRIMWVCVKPCLYFVCNTMPMWIVVCNVIRTVWWSTVYVWIEIVWYLITRVVVWHVYQIMYLVTLDNAISNSKIPIVNYINLISVNYVHSDTTLIFNSYAHQSHPSAIPMILIQVYALLATPAINLPLLVIVALLCSIVYITHLIYY
jgi:hypothetical protein